MMVLIQRHSDDLAYMVLSSFDSRRWAFHAIGWEIWLARNANFGRIWAGRERCTRVLSLVLRGFLLSLFDGLFVGLFYFLHVKWMRQHSADIISTGRSGARRGLLASATEYFADRLHKAGHDNVVCSLVSAQSVPKVV